MININGKRYEGNSISVNGNKITIDGKDVTPNEKEIVITVLGNIEKLDVDSCKKIAIVGNCGSVKTMSGNVDIDSYVSGNVKTMSGSVDCSGNISGSVSTMSGNIKSKKR